MGTPSVGSPPAGRAGRSEPGLLAAALHAGSVPMVILDSEHLVVHVNAAGAALVSYPAAGLVGSPVWEVLGGAGPATVHGVTGAGGDRRDAERRRVIEPVEQLCVGPLGDRRRYVWTFTELGDPYRPWQGTRHAQARSHSR